MMFRRALATLSLAAIVCLAVSAPAAAQSTMTKEGAAVVKAQFLADLDELTTKFVAIAEAFPQDKYTWRPMEGVRSVSEVLMLVSLEGYSFIPNSFGLTPAEISREEMGKMRTLSDKAEVVSHVKKALAHAKAQVTAADPGTLTGTHKVMGQDMTATQTAQHISGDLHEHLGQLIAYARMNHVVPPWSK
jgi:uncharacterized damage-inducible protein DinB